jgi:hypothetical protein
MAFYGREEEGERLGEESGIVQGRRGLEDRVALTDVEKEAGRGERGKIARTAEKRRAENLKIVKELHMYVEALHVQIEVQAMANRDLRSLSLQPSTSV